MSPSPLVELHLIEPGRTADDARTVALSALPLTIGGPDSDVALTEETSAPAAFLGVVDGELFVQAAADVLASETTEALLNGVPLSTSHWIESGDALETGSCKLCFEADQSGQVVTVLVLARAEPPLEAQAVARTAPPELELTPPPPRTASAAGDERFRPRSISRQRRRAEGRKPWRPIALVAALVLLAGAALWLLRARSLDITITPSVESFEIVGPGLHFPISGRYVLHPGSYRIEAATQGFAPLSADFEVTSDSPSNLQFSLEPLPGLVEIDTAGIAGARVVVNGEEMGATPLDAIELPAGTHRFEVSSEGHFAWQQDVEVAGLGERQTVVVELSSRRADLEVSSIPSGARVLIDGREVGRAPTSVALLSGSHSLELRLPGYLPVRRVFEIEPRETLQLGPMVLEEAPALVRVESRPEAALVSLDGVVRGQAPIELALTPGQDHRLLVSRTGHQVDERVVRLERGERSDLLVELQPILAQVVVRPTPAAAQVYVDGEAKGRGEQSLELAVATPHVVEVRLDGYESQRTTVTPASAGPVRELDIQLVSVEEVALQKAAAAAPKPRIVTSAGQELVLIPGGSFRAGASRREPGRRANETRRSIELRRGFYFGTREVTNKEFEAFRSQHGSGIVGAHSLEIDSHPVVNVSWQDAALYCNWLSQKDGLEPVYENGADGLEARSPVPNGYRLPTEAEWTWVARYDAGAVGALKYPWGASLPVAEGSGNYADRSAASLLPSTIEGYNDGYTATAPVTAFPASARGIYGLGGNVAEWMHDRYKIYSAAEGSAAVIDPLGPAGGELFVIRGASWRHSGVTQLRLSFRDYGNTPRNDLGFRIARYVD